MAEKVKEIGKYLIKNSDGYFVLKTTEGNVYDIYDSTFAVLKNEGYKVEVFGVEVDSYQSMHQAAMGGVGANAIKNLK